MIQVLIAALGAAVLIVLADIRIQRLKAAGHIKPGATSLDVIWVTFALPVLSVLWAGVYEMIRTVARGRRQKPPFGPFLTAWASRKAQPIRQFIRVQETGKERRIEVTEWVRPPRPPGRPRKYPQGWQAARRTGRPRGRPRKVKQSESVPLAPAQHDQ